MNMLKTIRRQMGLAALWVMAGLLAACTDDTFGDRADRVPEGIPVTVRLGFQASEATPETRAEKGEEYENRVDNVYILIFDEQGAIHDRFFLTPGEGLTYESGDNLLSSGELIFSTTSLNNATIVGIANLADGNTSTAYTVTEADLDAVTTLGDLQAKVMKMRDASVDRSAYFMMTGYATTTVDGNETYLVTIPALESGQTAELQCTLELERTDAKVKFVVTAEKPADKDWTEFSFQPTGWTVKQVPRQSLILPREEADANGHQDADDDNCTYFETSSTEFEEITRSGALYTGGSFAFYMPENRKKPTQNITVTGADGKPNYALRDKRNEDGAFTYANAHSTYVEITGHLSYFEENIGLTYANVRFTIHLGYADGNVNDYATLRNHFYTYYIKVRGVDDIEVDMEDNEDRRPGYDGDVVVSTASYQFDSHYDRRLIRLHQSGFLPDAEGGTVGTLRWGVSTPFSKVVHEVVEDANSIEENMRDYRWIKFAVNSEYGVDDDKMVKYPGDQNYNNPFPINPENNDQSSPYYKDTHPNARLRDVNQLMLFLREEAAKGKQSTIFDSDGYVYITAFVDENVYTHNPRKDNEEDLTLWRRMAETDDRQLYIIVDEAEYTDDHLSSVIKARYSFRQRSVRTIYNVNNPDLKTAWGLESTMEPEERIWTGSIANGIETTSKDNGRLNTLRILLGNEYAISPKTLHWTDVLSVEDEYGLKGDYNRAIYACLIRNRDLNGDNVVDADEIRWYLASINQLVDIYLGEYALDEPSRLYPRNSVDRPATPGYNNVRWHYTSSSYDQANDPWVLWSEEGASVGRKYGNNNDSEGVNGEYYSYRCLRNLGLPLNEPDKEPEDLVKVYQTSNGVYQIDLSNMNINSRRTNLETELAAHNERQSDNRPYACFEVHPNYFPENGTFSWQYYQTQDVCPTGYRVPNQRELLIMSTRLPSTAWTDYSGYYMSQTAFSLKGQHPYNNNRVGFIWNTTGNFILVNGTETGVVRPVKDITSVTGTPVTSVP